MHDEEIGIIDVELDGLEEVLYCLLLCAVAVDEVFACSSENNLAGDADLGIFFESDGGLLFVAVVEDDCDACFRYSGLSTLVDEILTFHCQFMPAGSWTRSAYLEILCADRSHIRNTQNKTYRVENITLSTSVEPGNRIEALVPVKPSVSFVQTSSLPLFTIPKSLFAQRTI